MRMKLCIPVALALLALASCSDDTPSMGDEGLEKEIKVTSPTFNIINILRATGNSVKVTGKSTRPFFADAEGRVLLVNEGVTLEVYEFSSSEDVAAAVSKISPDGSTVEGEPVQWSASPHFYKTEKVIILYLGDDPDNQRELATTFGGQFAGK